MVLRHEDVTVSDHEASPLHDATLFVLGTGLAEATARPSQSPIWPS